jgi:hypothetical protein
LIEPVTRHAATSIGGVAPGGSKAPAGTSTASVIVVSGKLRLARLSHDIGAAAAAKELPRDKTANAAIAFGFITPPPIS